MVEKVKRTKRIEIAVTNDELIALHKRKTKARLAEWIRDVALAEEINIKPKIKPIDPLLLYELNKIGVNLNQIARHCNSKKSDVDLAQIVLLLRSIDRNTKGLLEIYAS